MTTIDHLYNQQYGFYKWRNCDNIIKRLSCTRQEQLSQLLPSPDTLCCDTPIFACKYAQKRGYESYLALANEDGQLAINDTTVENHLERCGIRAHNNAVFDIAWMFEQMKIVTASGDHLLKLFHITNTDIREENVFAGHSRSVKTVAFRKDDPSVFASGGRDGNIFLWDTRTKQYNCLGKSDRTIFNSHNIRLTPSKSGRKQSYALSSIKSVTGLVFQNEFTLISCGAGDGDIKIWDIRKSYFSYKDEPLPKYRIPYPGTTTRNGYSNLIMDNNCTKLYANCLDNNIYCYNINSYDPKPIIKYNGYQNNTFYIKSSLNKNGLYLISGSSDDNAYIWNTNYDKPIVKLIGHNAEVTCVAWSEKNDFSLVTCSDDMTHKIWRIGNEFRPDNWEIIGRGHAEVIPLVNQTSMISQRKRSATSEIPLLIQSDSTIVKKLIKRCDKCENIVAVSIDNPSLLLHCQNCTRQNDLKMLMNSNKKRKKPSSDDDDDNDNNILPGTSSSSTKRSRRLFSDITQDLAHKSNDESLTINLPNYVMDGVAPHLNFSPPKKKKQDWLTKMRIEKKFKRDLEDMVAPAPTSPKVPRLAESGAKKSLLQNPILNFFKVTNNNTNNKCDNINGSLSKNHLRYLDV